jgi:hypothetical protein
MEPINYQNASVPAFAVAVPLGVRIISWIVLFFGVLIFLEALIIIVTSLGSSLALVALLPLAQGALLIFVASGVRKMKRWGLYLFTVLAILSIATTGYVLMRTGSLSIVQGVDMGISLMILAYFWSMRSRWV